MNMMICSTAKYEVEMVNNNNRRKNVVNIYRKKER